MKLRDQFSEAEIKMFQQLPHHDLLSHANLMPSSYYRLVLETVFLKNLQGPAVEALRRTANAFLINGKPYRLSPKFDKLAKMEEK